jgi:hypothetical protein
VTPTERERILTLFQTAASVPAPLDGPTCDDMELLTAWRQHDLTAAEEERFFAHLDSCPACRRVVVELASVIPTSSQPDAVTTPRAGKPSRTHRLVWTGIVATAACLVIGLVWSLNQGEPDEFARAREDIRSGHPDKPLQYLDALRPKNDAQRAEWMRLLEQAAYETALPKLTAGQYGEANAVCRSVREKGVSSARMANLELMATAEYADRVPGELALAFRPTLLHWGFRPDGTRPEPPLVQPNSQRLEEWRHAFRQYPDDEFILMNYGTFLLTQREFDAARDAFLSRNHMENPPSRAVSSSGVNPWDGAAIATFGPGDNAERVELARKDFMADGRHLTNPNTLVNAAVCLERLGKRSDAERLWQQARPLVSDPAIKRKIEHNLDRK